MGAIEELNRVVELLVKQVGHWEPPRWAVPTADGDITRAELVHRLVQRVADRAAEAAGEPLRVVPRPDNERSLPDQVRVVTADLIRARATPEVLTAVAAEVAATRRLL